VKAFGDKSIFILTSNVGQRMIAEMTREGKSLEEITARMKEALTQIRHTKSDRPVFTAEFLARLKRIIVFLPLGREAIEGISRKLTSDLAQTWFAKRGKRLTIAESLVSRLAARSHALNEASGGREGGRVVRKVLADWVEAALQREVTQRPDEYRRCSIISVDIDPAHDETDALPPVRIQFSEAIS
jgi:ATP-dependent Clp protease ATP-binding subunit ClpA